jgi:hypothetical protein
LQLKKNKYPIPKNFNNKKINLSLCYLPVELERYDKLKEFAELKNGKLITKTYLGRHSRYEWGCNVCGEIFVKKAHDVLAGKGWCPKCSKRRKPTTEEIKTIAREKGGRCLDPEKYTNYLTPLTWQCLCGYVWKASFFVVKNLKHWCHKCAKQIKPNEKTIQILAEQKNGICLNANEYINAKTKNLPKRSRIPPPLGGG